MAFENFTTYDEVDVSEELTITSTKIDFIDLAIDEEVYVTKDFEAGFFGDFIHRFKVHFESSTDVSIGGSCLVWAMSETDVHTAFDLDAAQDGLALGIVRSLPNTYAFQLWQFNETTNDNFITGTPPYDYYVEIERSGTTLTAKFYNNSNYTDLADTLTVTCIADTMRYLTPVGGQGLGPNDDTITGSVENLQLDDSPAVAVITKKNFNLSEKPITNMTSLPSTGMGSKI